MMDPSPPRGDAFDALLGAIESEMRARRLSPADVAQRAGVPVSTVQQLRRQRPTMVAALALAWALDIAPTRIRPTETASVPGGSESAAALARQAADLP
jgi:hypothetical protein